MRIRLLLERSRHNLAAFVLWCVLAGLYAAGAFMLVIGVVFAAREWWALLHQHASLWAVSAKTAELFALVAGFSLILIIPFLQRQARHQAGSWQAERRSEAKRQIPAAE